MIDVTSIILGVLTLLGGCGWVIDRKKHRQEIEALKADIRQKNLDLSTEFVEKFRSLISDPLEEQVDKLRNEVNQLRDALKVCMIVLSGTIALCVSGCATSRTAQRTEVRSLRADTRRLTAAEASSLKASSDTMLIPGICSRK